MSIALQVPMALWLTGFTSFFQDDFLFLEQARQQSFPLHYLHYLRQGLFEHFSPVSRLLDSLLALTTPPSFTLARAIEMLLYAGTVAAFAWVVVTILGRSWKALALTLLFGQSLFLMRLLMWWTATANILPCTLFGLLAAGFYLRWLRSGGNWRLALSLIAFAVSLLDYEEAMLLPLFLLLVRLGVLEERLTPRAWLRDLWRERWAWIGYGVLESAALANYLKFYYYPTPHPTAPVLARFLEIGLFQSFVPAVFGMQDPELAVTHSVGVVVAADLVAVGAVSLYVWRHRQAWRCIAAFLVVFLVAMSLLGLDRITLFGLSVAQELYYQQSLQFMFWVLVALALAPHSQGAQREPRPIRPVPLRLPPRLWVPLALLVAGAYSLAYVASVGAMAAATREAPASSRYVQGFLDASGRSQDSTGQSTDLLDLTVPPEVVATSFFPYNRYDMFFSLIDPSVRIDQAGPQLFSVSTNGSLLPETFHTITDGLMGSVTVSSTHGAPLILSPASGPYRACAPGASSTVRLLVPLAQPVHLSASDPPLYGVWVTYLDPAPSPVTVLLSTPAGMSADPAVPHRWAAGAAGDAFPLFAKGVQQVDGLAFDLPGGSCLTGLRFGDWTSSG